MLAELQICAIGEFRGAEKDEVRERGGESKLTFVISVRYDYLVSFVQPVPSLQTISQVGDERCG